MNDDWKRLSVALQESPPSLGGLQAIILFGSIVRDEAAPGSDIDLMFLFEGGPKAELRNLDTVSKFTVDLEAELALDHHVVPVIFGIEEEIEEYLRQRILEEGVVLWARPGALDWPGAKKRDSRAVRRVILLYGTPHLDAAERSRIQRKLFGHTTRKTVGGKTYESHQEGILEADEHIAPGTLLLSWARAREVGKTLQEMGARVRMYPVTRDAPPIPQALSGANRIESAP